MACNGWSHGNLIYIWLLETLRTFNEVFTNYFGDSFILYEARLESVVIKGHGKELEVQCFKSKKE